MRSIAQTRRCSLESMGGRQGCVRATARTFRSWRISLTLALALVTTTDAIEKANTAPDSRLRVSRGKQLSRNYDTKVFHQLVEKREGWLQKASNIDSGGDKKRFFGNRGMVTDEQIQWIRRTFQKPLYMRDLHKRNWEGRYITDSGLVVAIRNEGDHIIATADAKWSPARGDYHENKENTIHLFGIEATLGEDGIVRWQNGRKWLCEEAKNLASWKLAYRNFFRNFNINSTLPHRVTNVVSLDISVNERLRGRIVIALYGETVPKTCENFRSLCTGKKLSSRGTQLTYKNAYFHRIVKGFLIQSGDIVRGDGRSGESIYGKYFPDENFEVKHDRKYVVSMANSGNDTNQSQFFITLKTSPWLDGKNVAFGQVLMGQDIAEEISRMGDENGDPLDEVVITGSREHKIPAFVDASKRTIQPTTTKPKRQSKSGLRRTKARSRVMDGNHLTFKKKKQPAGVTPKIIFRKRKTASSDIPLQPALLIKNERRRSMQLPSELPIGGKCFGSNMLQHKPIRMDTKDRFEV
mmetsp:Transcript_15136/g.37106  ORF Transcript_15136/g.37106 Transcript_15136/m.37106 type:complete len:523 (+) Transcript_15136:136-1704(+)